MTRGECRFIKKIILKFDISTLLDSLHVPNHTHPEETLLKLLIKRKDSQQKYNDFYTVMGETLSYL